MKTKLLLAAMFDSKTYPHAVDTISMLQTHISWVFLTGDFAYKIKKPVDFGFLNFTDLDKRKFYCEQELRLNKKLAPSLYLEVCALVAHEQGFSLMEEGPAIEYTLKMHQFSQVDVFTAILVAGAFDAQWMDDLAEVIAGFHAMNIGKEAVNFHASTLLAEHIHLNLEVGKNMQENWGAEKLFSNLEAFAQSQLKEHAEVLKQRQADGFVRPCHGDLHLGNITLFEGKPCVFDCIEFNDEFRLIDTMNDVAFLVMDCDAFDRSDLGFRFLSRYLEQSLDYAGVRLLPLYLFYRATVRGKVACLSASDSSGSQAQRLWEKAQYYFHLAKRYCPLKPVQLFVVAGYSGSGKSSLALLGCGLERAVVIRSDALRKSLWQQHTDWSLYGQKMTDYTYQTMLESASLVLRAGFSVILDATFLQADYRAQVFNLGKEEGVAFAFYWLDVETTELQRRILERQGDVSDAGIEVLTLQLKHFTVPDETWVQKHQNSMVWPNLK